jgi:hypothetical protein
MELYKEYTGKEFKSLTCDKILVKLTNNKGEHNKYKFKTGLNIDNIKFDPTGECKAGGIYFILLEHVYEWLNYGKGEMVKMRRVTLEDESRVYIEKGKFKADKLILGEEILLKECFYFENIYKLSEENNKSSDIESKDSATVNKLSENQYNYIYKIVYKFLRLYESIEIEDFLICVKNNEEENILNYLKNNLEWIRFIRNPNEKICNFVLNINGLLLRYIKNQTKDICLTAVKNDNYAIKYVNEEFKEICKYLKEDELIDIKILHNKLRFIEKNYSLGEFIKYIDAKKINIKEINYHSFNYCTNEYILNLK